MFNYLHFYLHPQDALFTVSVTVYLESFVYRSTRLHFVCSIRCKCYVKGMSSRWKCYVPGTFSGWKCYVYKYVLGWKRYVRRKFRSQTSDIMDRWKKAEVRRVREEKIRSEKIREEKEREERRCRCAKR